MYLKILWLCNKDFFCSNFPQKRKKRLNFRFNDNYWQEKKKKKKKHTSFPLSKSVRSPTVIRFIIRSSEDVFSCINMDNCSAIYLKTHWQTFAKLTWMDYKEQKAFSVKQNWWILYLGGPAKVWKWKKKKKRGVSTIILVDLFFWKSLFLSSIIPLVAENKASEMYNVVVISVL